MDDKLKSGRGGKRLTADDCWPVMIEFLLSQKAWWVGICGEFDLTPMQGHAIRLLDRRIKRLVVTEKGRQLRDQLWARTMEPPAAVTALSDETRRRLAEALRAVVDERTAASSDPR